MALPLAPPQAPGAGAADAPLHRLLPGPRRRQGRRALGSPNQKFPGRPALGPPLGPEGTPALLGVTGCSLAGLHLLKRRYGR